MAGIGLASTAAAAPPGHGFNENEVVLPPPLDTCDGQQWTDNITGGPPEVTYQVRLIYKGADNPGTISSFTIPNFTVPPGTVNVDEFLLWDGYQIRNTIDQDDEWARIEFWNEGSLVAATANSEDLTDLVRSAWWSGDMGSFVLPDGADEVRIVHSSAQGIINDTNSLIPSGLCLTHDDQPPVTTTIVEPAPTTTVVEPAPTTTVVEPAPTTTVTPPATVAPTTTVPTEVGGIQQTTTAPPATTAPATAPTQLAVTGPASTLTLMGVALTLIAMGLFALDVRRKLTQR